MGRQSIFAVLFLVGCGENDGSEWLIKSPEQAIVVAEKACEPATKSHPGTWHTRLKNKTWLVWSDDGVLNVWVFADDPDRSLCVDESK